MNLSWRDVCRDKQKHFRFDYDEWFFERSITFFRQMLIHNISRFFFAPQQQEIVQKYFRREMCIFRHRCVTSSQAQLKFDCRREGKWNKNSNSHAKWKKKPNHKNKLSDLRPFVDYFTAVCGDAINERMHFLESYANNSRNESRTTFIAFHRLFIC